MENFRGSEDAMDVVPVTVPVVSRRRAVFEKFENTFRHPFIGLFYAGMKAPLSNWEKQVRGGDIQRVVEHDDSMSLEIIGEDERSESTYITTPREPFTTLGLKLPIMMIYMKPIGGTVLFTIQVKDKSGAKRRFQFSNATLKDPQPVQPFFAQIPLSFDANWEWNEFQVNLAELTNSIYGIPYDETVRVQFHANCRLRLIYFCTIPREIGRCVEILRTVLELAEAEPAKPARENLVRTLLLVPAKKPVYIPSFELSHFVSNNDVSIAPRHKALEHKLKLQALWAKTPNFEEFKRKWNTARFSLIINSHIHLEPERQGSSSALAPCKLFRTRASKAAQHKIISRFLNRNEKNDKGKENPETECLEVDLEEFVNKPPTTDFKILVKDGQKAGSLSKKN